MVKFFEDNDRMNWVDSNNVFVGFSNLQSCCESFGGDYWSSLNKDAVRVNIDEDNNDYVFDTSFYIEGENDATFKLSNGKKDIYLVIWNEHNGYYYHGFQFCNGDTVIVKGSI